MDDSVSPLTVTDEARFQSQSWNNINWLAAGLSILSQYNF